MMKTSWAVVSHRIHSNAKVIFNPERFKEAMDYREVLSLIPWQDIILNLYKKF